MIVSARRIHPRTRSFSPAQSHHDMYSRSYATGKQLVADAGFIK